MPKCVFSRPSDAPVGREQALLGVHVVLLAAAVCCSSPLRAFPPYETTDAETAGVSAVEFRLGLLQIEKTGSDSERLTPLSNLNFGLGPHFEISSEFEYAIDDRDLADGAVGFKWARLEEGRGIGVETLVLLPVRSELSGAGVQSQLLRTWQQEGSHVHLNVGAFYDPRETVTDHGWRVSALVEFPRDRVKPGVELVVRDSDTTDKTAQIGVGVIASLPRVEIRTGLHVGLNEGAPDLEGSLWLSWKWPKAYMDSVRTLSKVGQPTADVLGTEKRTLAELVAARDAFLHELVAYYNSSS